MNRSYTKMIGLSGFSLKVIHWLAAHIKYFRAECSFIGNHSFFVKQK